MRYTARVLVSLLISQTLVVACAPASTPTRETPPSSSTAPGSTTTSTEPVAVPMLFLSHDDVDAAANLLAGAVANVDGTVHAYVVAFSTDEQRVLHLSWDESTPVPVQSEANIEDLGLDFARPGAIPTSLLKGPDGVWHLFGWGFPEGSGSDPVFWRASAPDPEGPWIDAEIFYEVGVPGSWDGGWIDFPAVFLSEEGFIMIYQGAPITGVNASSLGFATSVDGIDWAHPAGSTVEVDDCEGARSLVMPRVVSDSSGLVMTYVAVPIGDDRGPIRISRADAPSDLSCGTEEPILTTNDLPSSGGIHSYATFDAANGPMLLVESLSNDYGSSDLWLVPLPGEDGDQ